MATQDQYVLVVETARGASGFTLYKNFGDPVVPAVGGQWGIEASSTLVGGFSKQETLPNGATTFTIAVSEP